MMRRIASGLILAAAIAAPAVAQDFDAMAWTRTEVASGDMIWIASEDLPSEGARPASAVVRILWARPLPRAPGPYRGEYSVVEYRFSCDGGVETLTWAYDREGPRGEPQPLPEREVSRRGVEGALFEIVCEGAPAMTDIEVGSAREALDYHDMAEDRGWNPPAGGWDRGPDREDREPVEPRQPPPTDL